MSFDWVEYCEVARELISLTRSSTSSEARARAAISRAYYAVFHAARTYLGLSEDYQPADKSIHAYIRDCFLSSSNDSEQEIGTYFRSLLNNRRKADYSKDFKGQSNPTNAATLSLAQAESIIRELSKMRKKP